MDKTLSNDYLIESFCVQGTHPNTLTLPELYLMGLGGEGV